MTCIIGAVVDDGVYIGGDNRAVDDWSYDDNMFNEKVFFNGEFLIGYTSSYYMGQLLRYTFTPREQPEGMNDAAYMSTMFVDDVRELFRSKGYMAISDAKERGGTFMAGYRGALYTVQNDFAVMVSKNGYNAIGSGMVAALGALRMVEYFKHSKDIARIDIELALKCVASIDSNVGGASCVLFQKNKAG